MGTCAPESPARRWRMATNTLGRSIRKGRNQAKVFSIVKTETGILGTGRQTISMGKVSMLLARGKYLKEP